MKNITRFLITMLVVLALCFSFTGCDGDNADEGNAEVGGGSGFEEMV